MMGLKNKYQRRKTVGNLLAKVTNRSPDDLQSTNLNTELNSSSTSLNIKPLQPKPVPHPVIINRGRPSLPNLKEGTPPNSTNNNPPRRLLHHSKSEHNLKGTGHQVDLNYKNLKVIPNLDKFKDSLEKLNLSYNSITDIPVTLLNFNNLTNINLRSNAMMEFPDVVCRLPNLKNLDISRNRIRSFPEEPGTLLNLQIFNISNNQFKLLPAYLGRMKNIEILKLDLNPFVVNHSILSPERMTNQKFWLRQLLEHLRSLEEVGLKGLGLPNRSTLPARPIHPQTKGSPIKPNTKGKQESNQLEESIDSPNSRETNLKSTNRPPIPEDVIPNLNRNKTDSVLVSKFKFNELDQRSKRLSEQKSISNLTTKPLKLDESKFNSFTNDVKSHQLNKVKPPKAKSTGTEPGLIIPASFAHLVGEPLKSPHSHSEPAVIHSLVRQSLPVPPRTPTKRLTEEVTFSKTKAILHQYSELDHFQIMKQCREFFITHKDSSDSLLLCFQEILYNGYFVLDRFESFLSKNVQNKKLINKLFQATKTLLNLIDTDNQPNLDQDQLIFNGKFYIQQLANLIKIIQSELTNWTQMVSAIALKSLAMSLQQSTFHFKQAYTSLVTLITPVPSNLSQRTVSSDTDPLPSLVKPSSESGTESVTSEILDTEEQFPTPVDNEEDEEESTLPAPVKPDSASLPHVAHQATSAALKVIQYLSNYLIRSSQKEPFPWYTPLKSAESSTRLLINNLSLIVTTHPGPSPAPHLVPRFLHATITFIKDMVRLVQSTTTSFNTNLPQPLALHLQSLKTITSQLILKLREVSAGQPNPTTTTTADDNDGHTTTNTATTGNGGATTATGRGFTGNVNTAAASTIAF